MSKFYEVPANYMKLLPEVFQGIKEFELLAEIINPYLDELNAILKRYTDNSNVLYADEEGIARWEKILAVSPPIGGTLEDRRNACLAKLRSRGIINLDTLRNVVETYLGVPVDIEMWWDAEKITWGEAMERYKTWGNVKTKNGEIFTKNQNLIPFIFTIAAQPKSQTLHHFMK